MNRTAQRRLDRARRKHDRPPMLVYNPGPLEQADLRPGAVTYIEAGRPIPHLTHQVRLRIPSRYRQRTR